MTWERSRFERRPEPIEITVVEVAQASPSAAAAQQTQTKRSKAVAKKLLQTPMLPPRQAEPEQRPVLAASLPPAAPAEENPDAGTPGGASGGALGGAPGGTGHAEEQPFTAPSYGAAYLHNPPPRYPANALRMKLQGTTTIRVLVSPEGRPQRVAVEKSSGIQLLDEAAIEAVRQWSFVPARQGDRAIAAEVNVPLRFRLTGAAVAPPDGADFN